MEGLLEMNIKERERLKILIRLEAKTISQKIASQQLKVSTRHVQRLYKAYLSRGEVSVVSLKRGKKSNNKLEASLKEAAAKLIAERYLDFGPTLAQEKLEEIHNIKISISSVRNIMIENGIWRSRKCKQLKIYQRRDPRDCIGELLQVDGSYHDWFEGRAPACCLIVLIDDATSRIMWLQFVGWESCSAYFSVLKAYLKKFGRPLSLYTDRLAVFETTRKTEKSYKQTQFHRALSSLGINLILAKSPQAKGRVERVNGTLQDRLIKEMRLARISSMEEGNAFLASYIEAHNKKFAKKPKSPIDAHRSLESDINLEKILCLHFERKITKDLMVSFKGKYYQILENYKYRLGGKKILVVEKENGEIELFYKNRPLKFRIYEELSKEHIKPKPLVIQSLSKGDRSREKCRPSRYHPWKISAPRQMIIGG